MKNSEKMIELSHLLEKSILMTEPNTKQCINCKWFGESLQNKYYCGRFKEYRQLTARAEWLGYCNFWEKRK